MATTATDYYNLLTGSFEQADKAAKLTQIQALMDNVGGAGVEATALGILHVFFPAPPVEGSLPASYARYGLRAADYYERDYTYQKNSKMPRLRTLTQAI